MDEFAGGTLEPITMTSSLAVHSLSVSRAPYWFQLSSAETLFFPPFPPSHKQLLEAHVPNFYRELCDSAALFCLNLSVFPSYRCCNKITTNFVKQHKFLSYASAGQKSKMGRQVCFPSGWSRGKTFCFLSFPASGSCLHSSAGFFHCLESPARSSSRPACWHWRFYLLSHFRILVITLDSLNDSE